MGSGGAAPGSESELAKRRELAAAGAASQRSARYIRIVSGPNTATRPALHTRTQRTELPGEVPCMRPAPRW